MTDQTSTPTTITASTPTLLPRITIRFCTQCKWMLRAAYVSLTFRHIVPEPLRLDTLTHFPLSHLALLNRHSHLTSSSNFPRILIIYSSPNLLSHKHHHPSIPPIQPLTSNHPHQTCSQTYIYILTTQSNK